MTMFIVLLLIVSSALIQGFLLDNSPGSSNKSSVYLTESKFNDEQKLQKQEIYTLRHDMNNAFYKLAMLTLQLKDKFEIIGNLENKLDALGNMTDQCGNHVSVDRYVELEQKYKALKQENELLKNNLNDTDNEQRELKNETEELKRQLNDLKQLGNIQPLQTLNSLQQTVQSLNLQTQSLSQTERARSQDFLALYNMTVNSRNKLHQLEMNLTGVNNNIREIHNNQTLSISNVEKGLQHQINAISEKVVLFSYPSSSGTINNGIVIKFNNVKFSTGISSNMLTTFKNNGKFYCEKPGVYLVSVSIMSTTSNARFSIYHNSKLISYTFIGQHDGNNWYYTGTSVVAVDLQVNDTVWIYAGTSFYLYDGYYSPLTIIKIY